MIVGIYTENTDLYALLKNNHFHTNKNYFSMFNFFFHDYKKEIRVFKVQNFYSSKCIIRCGLQSSDDVPPLIKLHLFEISFSAKHRVFIWVKSKFITARNRN